MALNGLICAEVPLRIYSLSQLLWQIGWNVALRTICCWLGLDVTRTRVKRWYIR